MTKHAIALVRWETFRPSAGTGGTAVYDYGSNNERLLDRVADGGTLWLVTSRRRGNAPRSYHLAYKLVACAPVDPHHSLFSGSWKYVVRAKDWEHSCHYPYNDAMGAVRNLRFASGKRMSDCKNIGLRLLGIPALAPDDIEIMQRLQHRIENGRTVFISYAHLDSAIASSIEVELGKREIGTRRDVAFLLPGQEWEEALRQEVMATDCFLALLSRSAADSKWVKREIAWAIREFDAKGLVKAIVPVVLSESAWEAFPELHRFQHWKVPVAARRSEAFDKLATGIVSARG